MMIDKLQALFDTISAKVENNPTPFSRYIQLFFAILSVRLALEFFSNQRLFSLSDVIHIGLWFTFIVMAFLIQLHLFSGEKILKIAKLVITFFTIALSAPIIDLLIFRGQGAKMNYLSLNTWESVVWSYFTIGGSSLNQGATPGIRVEIILLLIACFNYVYFKRRSIFYSILSVLSIYTVLFLSGAIPAILGMIVNTFHLQYQHDDQSTLLLLLSLDLFLLMVAFMRYSPTIFFKILKSTPWGALCLAFIHFGIGVNLALKNYPNNWHLTPTTLFWFPLLLGLILCFAAIKGVQNRQNQYIETPHRYYSISNTLLLLILIMGISISTKTFFVVALTWGLLYFLYESPLNLKKIPLLRNILEGMVFIAAALVGFSTFGAPMIGFPSTLLLYLLMSAIIGSLLIDVLKIGFKHQQYLLLCLSSVYILIFLFFIL